MRELVVYVAERSTDDPNIDRTKLAGLLFLCDFSAFARFGEPITGASYCKMPGGPRAEAQLTAERELQESGSIEIGERIVAKREADMTWLDADRRVLVDEVVQQNANCGAAELGALARAFPGYEIASDGEEIPYHAVYASTKGTMQADVDRGIELAQDGIL